MKEFLISPFIKQVAKSMLSGAEQSLSVIYTLIKQRQFKQIPCSDLQANFKVPLKMVNSERKREYKKT